MPVPKRWNRYIGIRGIGSEIDHLLDIVGVFDIDKHVAAAFDGGGALRVFAKRKAALMQVRRFFLYSPRIRENKRG